MTKALSLLSVTTSWMLPSGEATRYSASTQAYEETELAEMLVQDGFQAPAFYPSLTGKPDDLSEMIVLLAQK